MLFRRTPWGVYVGSGTSFSAPYVSGVAATLLSNQPYKSNLNGSLALKYSVLSLAAKNVLFNVTDGTPNLLLNTGPMNLMENSGFEFNSDGFCNGTICSGLKNLNLISPWVLSSGSTFELYYKSSPLLTGSWSINLYSNNIPYSISQNVTDLIPNRVYTLQFQLSSYSNCNGSISGYVQATNGANQTFLYDSAIFNGNWINITYQFLAVTTYSVIQVGSNSKSKCSLLVDYFFLSQDDLNLSTNIITNGNFETAGLFCVSTKYCIFNSDNNSAIYPWYTTGKYEVDTVGQWASYAGNWSLDLNADTPYSISQNVSLIVGLAYELSFMIADNYCGIKVNPNSTGTVYVTGNNANVFYHNPTDSGYSKRWVPVKYRFFAKVPNSVVTLSSTTSGPCGVIIDAVELHPLDNFSLVDEQFVSINPLNFVFVTKTILRNANFEDFGYLCNSSTLNYPYCYFNSKNNAAIYPWYSNYTFELDGSGAWPAWGGSYSLDLSSDNPVSISQSVPLVIGQGYSLTFMIRENPNGPKNKTGFVTATGCKTYNFYHSKLQSGGVANWTPVNYRFVAKTFTTIITIGGNSPGDSGIVLDAVYLVPMNNSLVSAQYTSWNPLNFVFIAG